MLKPAANTGVLVGLVGVQPQMSRAKAQAGWPAQRERQTASKERGNLGNRSSQAAIAWTGNRRLAQRLLEA